MHKYFEKIGLNAKKETNQIFLINVLGIVVFLVMYFVFSQLILGLFSILSLVIANYMQYAKYKAVEKNMKDSRHMEFVMTFSYVQVFLDNGLNIYGSLIEVIPYCSLFMQNAINGLLLEMDQDKSVEPFLKFAKIFANHFIEQAMLSLYLGIENGVSDATLRGFAPAFEATSDSAFKEAQSKKEKRYDSLNLFPLIGAALIALIIIASIATVVGGVLSGY